MSTKIEAKKHVLLADNELWGIGKKTYLRTMLLYGYAESKEQAIKEYIKDKDKLAMVESAIAEGHMQYHSQTFDQSLLELYNQDKISLDVALNAATNRDDFELKIRGITGTSERGWM